MVQLLLASSGVLERMVDSSWYLAVAGFSALFLLVSMLFGGHDHDADHDVDNDVDHDADHDGDHEHDHEGGASPELGNMSVFSVKVILATVAGYGVGGFMATRYGLGPLGCTLGGMLGGLIVGGLSYAFLNTLYRGQSSGTVRTASMVGYTGTVETTISANGIGRITCVLPTGQETFQARSTDGVGVSLGTPVKVTGTAGALLIVRPL